MANRNGINLATLQNISTLTSMNIERYNSAKSKNSSEHSHIYRDAYYDGMLNFTDLQHSSMRKKGKILPTPDVPEIINIKENELKDLLKSQVVFKSETFGSIINEKA